MDGVKHSYLPSGGDCQGAANCSVSTTPIQDAIDAVAGGLAPDDNTIYIEDGIYAEDFTIEGFDQQLLTLQSVEGSTPTLDGDIGIRNSSAAITLDTFIFNGMLRLNNAASVTVVGTDQDDTFDVALEGSGETSLEVDGCEGADTLNVVGTDGDDEIVYGEDITLNEKQTVSSADVEEVNIDAQAGDDTLVVDFDVGASIPEDGLTYDGGEDYDVLETHGGSFDEIIFTATAPDSGIIRFDGAPLTYLGLEPTTIGSPADGLVLEMNIWDDEATLLDSSTAGHSLLRSDNDEFKDTTFANPSTSLTIKMGYGDDVLTVESIDSGFDAALFIQGEDGLDEVSIISNFNLNTGGSSDFGIEAETISLDGASIHVGGTVSLLAYASDETTWEDLVPFYDNNAAETEIDIISSQIYAGGDIIIRADSDNVRDSDLQVDFSALSSVASLSGQYDPLVSFSPDGSGDQITRQYGSWLDDGFEAGQQIEVSGSTLNRGHYTVSAVSDTTLTLVQVNLLTAETDITQLRIAERRAEFEEQATTKLVFSAADSSITRDLGSWLDDGFVLDQTITVVGTANNDGAYTIASIDATILVLGESLADEADVVGADIEGDPIYFDDEGASTTLDFVHSDSANDTITRSKGSWIVDGFQPGQEIIIYGVTADGEPIEATIDSRTAGVLTLTAEDSVSRSRERVSGASIDAVEAVFAEPASTQINFTHDDDLADTITRDAGSWVDDGFAVGMTIQVTGTRDELNDEDNDGRYLIASISGDGLTLTLDKNEQLTTQTVSGVDIEQAWKVTDAEMSQDTTLTFGDAADTISRDTGDWLADGFLVDQIVTIENAANTGNNGAFKVTAVTEKTLTLSTTDGNAVSFTAEDTTSVTILESDESIDQMRALEPLVTITAADKTMRRDVGTWQDDGFAVGMSILVGGSANDNDGKYHIDSITGGGTVLHLSEGPATVTDEASYEITVREDDQDGQAVLKSSTPRLTFSDNGTADTIQREAGSWLEDGFSAGQDIEVSGSENNDGDYTIGAISGDGLTLTLTGDDALTAEARASDVTVDAKSGDAASLENSLPEITFADNGAVDTITRSHGSWFDDKFLAGQTIIVSSSTTNDGTFVVDAISADGLVLTLDSDAELTGETSENVNITRDADDRAELEPVYPQVTLVDNGDADQIQRSVGSWIDDGFEVGRIIHLSGSDESDGTYQISAVTAATLTLTLDAELTDESDLEEVYISERQADFQHTAPALAFVHHQNSGDTITREVGSWSDEGFALGQDIEIADTESNDGVYTIAAISGDGLTLTLMDDDELTDESLANLTVALPDLDFTHNDGSADTITRSEGSWLDDGFEAEQLIRVIGSENNDNDSDDDDDYYTIDAISPDELTLTLASGDTLVTEMDVADVTVTSGYGVFMDGTLPELTFADSGSADTIARAKGSWLEDGFEVGQEITVSDSTDNDGDYTIQSISADGLTLTLSTSDTLTVESIAGARVDTVDGILGVSVSAQPVWGKMNPVDPTLTFSNAGRTINRNLGSWSDDGFSAEKRITILGTENNNGSYEISSISTDGKTLTLTTDASLSDETTSDGVDVTQALATLTGGPTLTFHNSSGENRDYIIRNDAKSWLDDGFQDGMTITVVGSASNDGDFLIDQVTSDKLYLGSEDLADEGSVADVQVYADLNVDNVPLVPRDRYGDSMDTMFAGAAKSLLEKVVDFVSLAEKLASYLGVMPAQVVRGTASSDIDIHGTSTDGTVLDAGGNVEIAAISNCETSASASSLILGGTVAISNATATNTMGNYVTVEATGDFDFKANVSNTLSAATFVYSGSNVMGVPLGDNYFAPTVRLKSFQVPGPSISFAVGLADSTSTATIASDVGVTAASVSVAADNANDFTTSTYSLIICPSTNFGVGVGVSFAEYDSEATATLGGTITSQTGDVSVSASSTNSNNAANAFSWVRDELTRGEKYRKKFSSKLGLNFAKDLDAEDPGKFSLAGAVVIAFATSDVLASIASDAVINSAADVSVSAAMEDNIRIWAWGWSEISTATAFGGAVQYAEYENTVKAWVDSGASVTLAGDMSVTSEVKNPDPFRTDNDFMAIYNGFKDYDWPTFPSDDGDSWDFFSDVSDYGSSILSNDLNSALSGLVPYLAALEADDIFVPDRMVTTSVASISRATPGESKKKTKFAANGCVTVFSIANTAEAYIGEGVRITYTNPGDLDVTATALTETINVGGIVGPIDMIQNFGAGSQSDGGALGGTAVSVKQHNTAKAHIDDGAVIVSVDHLTVDASADNFVITIAQSGSKGKVGLNGVFILGDIDNTSKAWIEDKAQIDAAGNVTVEATSDFFGVNVGGAITRGEKFAMGLSGAYNNVDNITKAFIGNNVTSSTYTADGHVTAGGDVTVNAQSSENLWSFTVAGSSAGGKDKTTPGWQPRAWWVATPYAKKPESGKVKSNSGVSVSGAAAVNIITDETWAYISDIARVDVTGTVTVSADNSALVVAGTGGFGLTTSAKGGGLAGGFAWNDLSRVTKAYTQDTTINAADLIVMASSDDMIISITAGASGSKPSGKTVNLAGSANLALVDNETVAAVGDDTTVTASDDVEVKATTETSAIGVAGGIAVGGKAGLGASVDFAQIENNTDAYVGNGADLTLGGNLLIAAESTAWLISIAVSVGIGGKGMGLSGAAAVQKIITNTDAYLHGGAVVDAGGSVLVDADDTNFIVAVAGQAAGGKKAGVGASVVVTLVTRNLNAYIGSGAEVTADGNGTAIEDPQDEWNNKRGVVVEAVAEDDYYLIAAGGAGGGKVGFAASAVVSVIESTTLAYIGDNAIIITSEAGGESASVDLNAEYDANFVVIAGSAQGSQKAGIGAAAWVGAFSRDTKAYIGSGATVTADGDVNISADLNETIWAVTAGVGGSGKVTVEGSAVVLVISGTTMAAIKSNADVSVDGNVDVAATGYADLNTIAGQAGFGGKVGFGISASVLIHTDNVKAYLANNAHVTALGDDGLSVTSDSSEEVLTISAGASGGGKVGLVGSAVVNVLTETTQAYLGANAKINENNVGASTTQDVVLDASDTTDIISVAGSAGFGGSAGIGVGADVGLLSKTTSAYIADSALVNASDDVLVTAESLEDVITVAGNVGVGGKAGIAGSVSVYVVITQTTAYIGKNTTVDASGDVGVTAKGAFDIIGVAGQISGGGKVGVGASAVVVIHSDTVKAFIDSGANVTALGLGDPTVISTDGRVGSQSVSMSAEKPTLTLADNDSADTITRSGGSWVDDGFEAGQEIRVTGTDENDGTNYVIDSISADELTLTLSSGDELENETASDAQVVANDDAGASMMASMPALTFTDSGSADTIARATGSWLEDGFEAGQTIVVTNAGVNSGRYVIESLTANTLTLSSDSSVTDAVTANSGLIGKSTAAWTTDTIHGLVVSSNSSENLLTVAAGLSIAGTGSIAGSAVVNVLTETTQAYIEDATVNGDNIGASSTQGAYVLAADETDFTTVVGTGTFGGKAGVGFGADVAVLTKNTQAWISGNLAFVDDLSLKAVSREDVFSVVGNITLGGYAGMAGSAGVYVVTTKTKAYLKSGTILKVGGNALLIAEGDYDMLAIAGQISGGAAGGGISNVTLVHTDSVEAFIGNSANVTALGSGDPSQVPTGERDDDNQWLTTEANGLIISAISYEDILSIAAGASGGGTTIVGSATVEVLGETTKAYIGDDAVINSDNTGASADQDLRLLAIDITDIIGVDGVAAYGGGTGIGAAADVGVIIKTTKAYLGPRASVDVNNNMILRSVSEENIISIGGNITIGGSTGIAGAAGVYVISNNTLAYIGSYAQVHAGNNVVVSAENPTEIDIAGGSVSFGASTSVGAGAGVTVISKVTKAYIGTYAQVDADATGDGFSVHTGDFSVNYSDDTGGTDEGEIGSWGTESDDDPWDFSDYNVNPEEDESLSGDRDATPETAIVKGVAVTATSKEDIEIFGLSGTASGSLAVNGGATVDVNNVKTCAYIDAHAQVNRHDSPADGQSVLVAAGSDYSLMAIAGSLGLSGTASVGAGVDVTVIDRETFAYIEDSASVAAEENIAVVAKATEDILSISATLQGSLEAAVAGTVSVIVLDSKTQAFIGRDDDDGIGATAFAGGNILVSAQDNTDIDLVSGGIAVGLGGGGVGTAVGVNVINKDTRAYIGDYSIVDARANTATTIDPLSSDTVIKGLALQAASSEELMVITANFSAGMYVGLAGAVSVDYIDSDTQAYIGAAATVNMTDNNSGAAAAQSVDIAADNYLDLFVVDAAGGIGAGGIGGAVDVGTLRNDTSARIENAAAVVAMNDIRVDADSDLNVESWAFSLGGAGLVGLNASVSVYAVGQNLEPQGEVDPDDSLSDEGNKHVYDYADDQMEGTMNNILGQYSGGSDQSNQRIEGVSDNVAEYTQDNSVKSAIEDPLPAAGTTATIGTGAIIVAGGDVTVHASETNTLMILTGGATLGVAGVGGSVSVVSLTRSTTALLNGNLTADGTVTVHAEYENGTTNDQTDIRAYAGSGGLVSIAGAVAVVSDEADVEARLGSSAVVNSASSLVITADTFRDIYADAVGAVAGLVVGANGAVSIIDLEGSTKAYAQDVKIGNVNPIGTIAITADAENIAEAHTVSASGSFGVSLAGSYAEAETDPDIEAHLDIQGTANLSGNVSIEADSKGKSTAEAMGVSVSLASVGAAFAVSDLNPTVKAYLDGGSLMTGGNLLISAKHNFSGGSPIDANKAYAEAEAPITVGLLGGGTGCDADATASATMSSYLASGSVVDAQGDVTVQALGSNKAYAETYGLTVGGVSVGASLSTALSNAKDDNGYKSDGTTKAYLDGTISDAYDVTVEAQSWSDATAKAEANAGGIVSGSGADATAYALPTVKAYVGDNVSITARHDVTINAVATPHADATADGINAGGVSVGVSLAYAESSPTVNAWVGTGTCITGGIRLKGDPKLVFENYTDHNLVLSSIAGSLTFTRGEKLGDPKDPNDNVPDTITRNDGGSWLADGIEAGDTIIITNAYPNNGSYEVDSLTATTLTLVSSEAVSDATKNDVRVQVGDDRSLTVVAEMSGDPDLKFTNGGADVQDTIERLDSANWSDDGFVAGQYVQVADVNDENDGVYLVDSLNGAVITLRDTNSVSDGQFSGSEVRAIEPTPDTLTRLGGDWREEGFLAGDTIIIAGTAHNDGTYQIDAISDDGLTLTLDTVGVLDDEVGTGFSVQLYERPGQDDIDDIGGNVTVAAGQALPGDEPSARAESSASGGGLIDVKATDSTAKKVNGVDGDNTKAVAAYVESDSAFNLTGTLRVGANTDSYQWASTTSYHGGIVAVGHNPAEASSESDTFAYLESGVQVNARGLKLSATGDEENYAESTAGQGGVISVAVSNAETDSDSSTKTWLGDASGTQIVVENLELIADHRAEINSKVDSINVSIAGYGGAEAENYIDSDVKVDIGAVDVQADDIQISAVNEFDKPWLPGDAHNADSTGISLIDVPADWSNTYISGDTQIAIGAGASLEQTSDPFDPGEFDLSVLNDIYARDKVKVESYGAVPVPRAASRVVVGDNDADEANAEENDPLTGKITIGNADLISTGDLDIYVRINSDIETHANGKAGGLAGQPLGDSLSKTDVDNIITIQDGALLYSKGQIRLLAGRTPDYDGNLYINEAYTDLWNWTAFPLLKSSVDAYAEVDQINKVDIQAGSELKSVKDVVLSAYGGSGETSLIVYAQGRGTDLYREGGEEIFGDEVSFDVESGDTDTISDNRVIVNGIIRVGIQNKMSLAIDGSITEDNGQETVSINFTTDPDPGITYSHGWTAYSLDMMGEILRLEELKIQYAGNTAAVEAFDAEIERLHRQMNDLGYCSVHDDVTVCESEIPAYVVEIDDVLAQSSDIWVEADSVSGSGEMHAPGDAEITIDNNGPFYLWINRLTIPDDTGGRVLYNESPITSLGAITINASADSAPPRIEITSSYVLGGDEQAPDIEILNDISAPVRTAQGEVYIENLSGSVLIKTKPGSDTAANITAYDVEIIAGCDFVQGYVDGFYHSGGSPAGVWSDVGNNSEAWRRDRSLDSCWNGKETVPCYDDSTARGNDGSIIAGNMVFISARYLNINGLIQSGIADRELVLDSATYQGKIDNFENWYNNQKDKGKSPDEKTALREDIEFVVYYNAETDEIELARVIVEGGYMELTGHIMSTGGGEIKVMDGYGRIVVDNQLPYDLVLHTLDAGHGVEGKLVITDTADSESNPTVTEYTVDGATRNYTYEPRSPQSYVWVTGQRKKVQKYEKYSSSEWLGADWAAKDPDDLVRSKTTTLDKVILWDGDYLIFSSPDEEEYQYEYQKLTLEGWSQVHEIITITAAVSWG